MHIYTDDEPIITRLLICKVLFQPETSLTDSLVSSHGFIEGCWGGTSGENYNWKKTNFKLLNLRWCVCPVCRFSQSLALCWGSSCSQRTVSSRLCCSIPTERLHRQLNWWESPPCWALTQQTLRHLRSVKCFNVSCLSLCFSLWMDRTSIMAAAHWESASPNSPVSTWNTTTRRAATSPDPTCQVETASRSWSTRPWRQRSVRPAREAPFPIAHDISWRISPINTKCSYCQYDGKIYTFNRRKVKI